jgi:hypothetical protein
MKAEERRKELIEAIRSLPDYYIDCLYAWERIHSSFLPRLCIDCLEKKGGKNA